MTAVLDGARRRVAALPWVWSYLALFVTWIVISVVSGRGFGGTLTSAFGLAPFLVLVGIGQMFVITLGNGHIDLSVPYTLVLAAFLSTSVMDGGHGSMLLGFGVALLAGLAVGIVNVIAIVGLRIPPIVATLAVGLMVQSAASVRASKFSASVDPALASFTQRRIGPVSLLALLCVAAAVIAGVVLHRSTYGRSVQAVGQKIGAARLTGLPVNRVVALTYLGCALSGALAGVLLGAFSSPSLDLGDPYLLNSIAVVVLGGSLISGGRSNVTGIWGSALFLGLLVTLLNVLGINVALQNIVKGVMIILVLALMGAKRDT